MRSILNSYKQYIKMRKLIMIVTKVCNKLVTAFTQLFVIIGVLAVFSEIVDRVSTRKYLKEHEIGKTEKEDDVVKRIKF